MLHSVIIPCYKSSHTIRQVVEETSVVLTDIGRTPFEFVLVDDCSPDNGDTLCELKALAADYDYVTVVELAQNAGQHNAVMAGLNYAQGDVLIAMDDDMQTHPSQLPVMFEEFDKGYDIVYGYYPEKHHSLFRNFGSWVNYQSVRILIGKPKELKTSSFWIIRKFVRDYVVEYKSHYTHLQGLFLRTTRNIACVPIEHFDRAYGKSGYTLNKLISLWSNIMGYSIVPLRMATKLGVSLSALSIIAAIIIVIRKLTHPATAVGWSSMMVTVIFFAGLILFFLGIIGEYLGRMFQGMTHEPQFVVRHVYSQIQAPAGRTSGTAARPKAPENETPIDQAAQDADEVRS